MRILIVEDDVFTVSGLGEYLAGVPDFEVVGIAGSGEDAIALLRASVELVILDVKLPDMDGEAVLQRMAEQAGRPRALVFSALEDAQTATRNTGRPATWR